MDKFRLFVFLLALPFLFISLANADDSEQRVCTWAEQILMKTLSASYADTAEDIASVQQYYMPSAWWPMKEFFSDKRDLINNQRLILHPQLQTAATVISQGYCGGVLCWRVNLAFYIPELHQDIKFSLLILPTSKGNAPFIVQSLDMILSYY
ncbi:Macrophage killing protein with similarity to conjugation protein [Legionella donaldsonii]|uniref:Macrophage killing protein with similarity to conjugation protein n=1 Tax=Legionella donaldsonii TaxID=45060 RepID=A0A378J0C3_9GAMM|nr:DotI/IcmL/TraM family protein [Legionella donaldsonii]STX41172.1 Macrophage killing protein with similarity to conjugation protein [Legionella donaldsonii]